MRVRPRWIGGLCWLLAICVVFPTPFGFSQTSQGSNSLAESYKRLLAASPQTPSIENCNSWLRLGRENQNPQTVDRLVALEKHLRCAGLGTDPLVEKTIFSLEPVHKMNFSLDEMSWLALRIQEAIEATLPQMKAEEERAEALLFIARLNLKQRERFEALRRAEDAGNLSKNLEWKKNFLERLDDQRLRVAPRLNPSPKPDEFEKVVSDFFENLEYEEARKWIQRYLRSKSKLEAEREFFLRRAYAQSFKRQQKKKENLKALRDLYNWVLRIKLEPGQRHEAITLYARALWTAGDQKAGEKLLKKHLPEFETKAGEASEPAAEIYWILARMYEERRKYEQAGKWFSQGIARCKVGSDLHEKLLFMRAWNFKKIGNKADAIKDLEALKDLDRKPSELARYEFWLGWMLDQSGYKMEAEAHFERIEELDPFGYYAVLTKIYLKQKFPPLFQSTTSAKAPSRPSPEGERKFNDSTLDLLRSLGDQDLVESYSEFQLSQLQLARNPDAYLHFALVLSESASHLPLFRYFNQLESREKQEFFQRYPDSIFPRKHLESISKAAAQHGVPEDFVLSIIRQESTFDPEARSPADAMGLMQVLASQGQALAKKAKVELKGHEDLFVPEINISIGTLLLSQVYKKFDGNFLLAAAGYNANPIAVRKWIRARQNQSFIEFIEEIPYEETRTYMKLILRNFLFYRRLKNPTQALDSPPEECIKSLQFPKVSTGKKRK